MPWKIQYNIIRNKWHQIKTNSHVYVCINIFPLGISGVRVKSNYFWLGTFLFWLLDFWKDFWKRLFDLPWAPSSPCSPPSQSCASVWAQAGNKEGDQINKVVSDSNNELKLLRRSFFIYSAWNITMMVTLVTVEIIFMMTIIIRIIIIII